MKQLSLRHQLVAGMPYLLLSLLIEYKALSSYLDNALDRNTLIFKRDSLTGTLLSRERKVIDVEILNDFTKHSKIYMISCAFDWSSTIEGYEFWCNLNSEYYERLYPG